MRATGVIRFPVDPRLVPAVKVARRLGLRLTQFEEVLPALVKEGFPAADPLLGNYCLEAVDKWIDARSGLTRPGIAVSDPSTIMERIKQRAWAR